MDKPKVPAKLAVASSTPKASVCVWMFIGNAPPLERDVKAKPNTEDAFLK